MPLKNWSPYGRKSDERDVSISTGTEVKSNLKS